MDDGYSRYAIYFAPAPDSELARLGRAWLGWCAETGERPEPLDVPGLPVPREQLTRRPARYGLHGTLKAPFRLASRISPEDLNEAVAAVAAGRRPISAPPLRVDAEMGFVALVPSEPCPLLDELAAACVTEIDPMRAALTASEFAEKRRGGLDPIEDRNLRSWGYPFVLDRFRFHITLTGPLDRRTAMRVRGQLVDAFAPALTGPLGIADICLFGDPGGGAPFRLIRRYRLSGG